MDKIGKGQLLRRAAEYITELSNRMGLVDEEILGKEREKNEVQVSLPFFRGRSHVSDCISGATGRGECAS